MTIQTSEKSQATRRKFLRAAAATTAATVAAPAVVKAQGPITWRWQSTWPTKDIFHEYAIDYAKKVNDMTGGDLRIEVLPAGVQSKDERRRGSWSALREPSFQKVQRRAIS